jgi:hypothetical protein
VTVPTARSRAERRVSVVELRFESGTSSTYKFYRVYTCDGSEAAIVHWGRVATEGQFSVVAMTALPERLTDKTLNGYSRYGSTHVVVDADTWVHATGSSNSTLSKQAFQTISQAATAQMFPESQDETKTRLMKAAQEFIAALEPIARGEWPQTPNL